MGHGYLHVTFSSVQGDIYVLRKAHMHCTLSLRNVPNVAFETIPTETMALSRPFKEDH